MRKQLSVGMGTAAAVLAMGAIATAEPWKVQATDKLTSFAAATEQPFEAAQAHVTASAAESGETVVSSHVTGIDHGVVGRTFGAHVHTGPCDGSDSALAGGHYNHGGGISASTEVWLDFTVHLGGVADATATVPFTIPADGANSVVIHALPTNATTGAAGARLACLSVDF